jgi:hypothetical protein
MPARRVLEASLGPKLGGSQSMPAPRVESRAGSDVVHRSSTAAHSCNQRFIFFPLTIAIDAVRVMGDRKTTSGRGVKTAPTGMPRA